MIRHDGTSIALRRATLGLYLALLALIAVWESWFAPTGILPRSAWLVIKLAPLVAVLVGVWRGSARAHVIAALIVMLYFIEGVVLAFGGARGLEGKATFVYALSETVLTLAFIMCASLYARQRTQAMA